MSIRALVVDDHDSWRGYASMAVEDSLGAVVVGEATDGLAAVADAIRLQPDLIVLDIGLPSLNGLDAGRQILAASPSSRIVYLSENVSADVACAAMELGASGYVVKSDAAFELRPALRRAVDGRLFVTGRLIAEVARNGSGDRLHHAARCHEAALCPDRSGLVDAYARFVGDALRAGSAALLASAGETLLAVERRLRSEGIDLDAAIVDEQYQVVDPQEIISMVLSGGSVDERRFWDATVPIVTRALRASRGGSPRVAACGAIAPVLWRQGHTNAAIRFEELVDEFTRLYDLDILCGYALDEGPAEDEGRVLAHAHAGHSAVYVR